MLQQGSQAPDLICRTIRSPASRMRDKVALLERLERYARALDPRVTQVMAGLAGEYEVVMVARSDGLMNADIRPLVRLSLQVIVESNGTPRARLGGRRRALRLRLFHRRDAAQIRRPGGASGGGQSGCAHPHRQAT